MTPYLAERIQKHAQKLSAWVQSQVQLNPAPFYSSVDIRDSGSKVVSVDCNLYPAGFNNLCEEDRAHAAPKVRLEIDRLENEIGLPIKKILILPENHTKNPFYVENLLQLTRLLLASGLQVQIGWVPSVDQPGETPPSHAQSLVLKQGRLQIPATDSPGFDPDLILLNNDFSGGYPPWLDTLVQPIRPTHHLGWHTRKKSSHFEHYNRVAAEFADILQVDSWLVQVETFEVNGVNFNDQRGIPQTAAQVGSLMDGLKAKYATQQITTEPFAFIKNNSGTYGMGIHVVRSAEEVLTLNRREKNKLSMGKGHQAIESVIVQEGVPTRLRFETDGKSLSAEPVIYLVGSEPIGGFLRVHQERGEEENLNSPGMVFKKLCLKDPAMGLVYPWIARLSALAAGREYGYKQKQD